MIYSGPYSIAPLFTIWSLSNCLSWRQIIVVSWHYNTHDVCLGFTVGCVHPLDKPLRHCAITVWTQTSCSSSVRIVALQTNSFWHACHTFSHRFVFLLQSQSRAASRSYLCVHMAMVPMRTSNTFTTRWRNFVSHLAVSTILTSSWWEIFFTCWRHESQENIKSFLDQ